MNELITAGESVPCISSQVYGLAVIGILAGVAGLCMVVVAARLTSKAARRVKAQLLGTRLLLVCHGDVPTAEKVIENAAADYEWVEAVTRHNLRLPDDYAQRRADFNAACCDESCGGPRWLDVQ